MPVFLSLFFKRGLGLALVRRFSSLSGFKIGAWTGATGAGATGAWATAATVVEDLEALEALDGLGGILDAAFGAALEDDAFEGSPKVLTFFGGMMGDCEEYAESTGVTVAVCTGEG